MEAYQPHSKDFPAHLWKKFKTITSKPGELNFWLYLDYVIQTNVGFIKDDEK